MKRFKHKITEIVPVLKKTQIKGAKISQAKDAEIVLREIWNAEGEELSQIDYVEKFYALYLNRANNVVGYAEISKGGRSGTVADGKVIFCNGLLVGACAMILAHNHPSNKMMPSSADIDLTKRLVQFGKLIDLPVLDHIIMGVEKGTYYSFVENGKM